MHLSTLSFVLLSCVVAHAHALSLSWWSGSKRASVCNGRSALCGRSYGNTTFIVAHNSFAFSANPFALARTQAVDVPTQLKLGVRALQGQAHMKDGQLHFCHTDCALFDGGLVVDYLRKVKSFLDSNPNEVLTLIFTNPEGQSVANVWKPLFEQSGIASLAYVPPSRATKRTDWPTLGQLIDSGKRVVVFLDNKADDAPTVDYILSQFPNVWESPFSPTDQNFPCSVDRSSGPLSNDDHMYLINHNLNANILPVGDGVLISDPLNAPSVNSVNSILANAAGCASFAQGRAPNFVLLDYVDKGEAFKAADKLNGF